MEFGNRGREGRYYGSRDEDDHQDNSTGHRPASFSSSTSEDQPSSSGAADPDPPPIPASEVEKEHMFDKVVTPSDVGKLNRLVIPKQHAEKYFPLDSSANEKGLLLNFEDRNGKPWRFRYSYWNSSQSYVMTKGWSRFVKEKRLDAGDTVSFGRGVGEPYRDRLFIDWKRRPENQIPPNIPRFPLPNSYSQMMSFARSSTPWGRLYTPSPSPVHSGYNYNVASPHLYPRSGVGMPPSHLGMQFYGSSSGVDGSQRSPIVFDSVPVGRTSLTSSKRVRLFGVNLDTPPSSEGIPSRPSVVPQQVRQIPPLLSLQLSLGDGGGTATAESPDTQDRQSMSLDLDV